MSYPVILNGDHAEFEAEWEGKDPKDRPDWPLPSFDAKDWAKSFCKRFTVANRDGSANDGDDTGLMIGWFANALMRGFDEAGTRERAVQSAFARGVRVRKISGSSWQGRVCGYYSTDMTPDGVCVESEREPGSVQIYPTKALTLLPESGAESGKPADV